MPGSRRPIERRRQVGTIEDSWGGFSSLLVVRLSGLPSHSALAREVMKVHAEAADGVISAPRRFEKGIIRGKSRSLHAFHHAAEIVREAEQGFVHPPCLLSRQLVAVHPRHLVVHVYTSGHSGSRRGS